MLKISLVSLSRYIRYTQLLNVLAFINQWVSFVFRHLLSLLNCQQNDFHLKNEFGPSLKRRKVDFGRGRIVISWKEENEHFGRD